MNEIEHDLPRLNENFTLLLVLKDRKTFRVSFNEIIAKKRKVTKISTHMNICDNGFKVDPVRILRYRIIDLAIFSIQDRSNVDILLLWNTDTVIQNRSRR